MPAWSEGTASRAAPHEAEIHLEYASARAAVVIATALASEATDELARARSRVEARGREVRLVIEAADVVSLRAGVNSYLRWARAAEEAAAAAAIGDGRASAT